MLPHAMEFNLPAAADRLALVAQAASIDRRGLTTEEAARAAVDVVRTVVSNLGCPTRLRDVGVPEADFPLLAEAVMEEVPLLENPRPISGVADIIDLLERAW
jgi:lactaldehyde reductase